MINFKLRNIEEIQPVGSDEDFSMSWFWLTDGELWLNFSDSTLYEYTAEAMNHFGLEQSSYNDYPIVRFIEDFTELFRDINESIPYEIYQLTGKLTKFLNDSQKWLDIYDTDEDEHSEFYFKEYDQLISWTYKRMFDSGHLIGGPKFSFFRSQDTIRIVWESEWKLENGIDVWTAKNGEIEIPYLDFIEKVKVFGKSFFKKMKKQVEFAAAKDWKDINLDKKRLVEEHAEREKEFYQQVDFLEQNAEVKTDWKRVLELKNRMENEIKTKA
jgi:hypothetical protein